MELGLGEGMNDYAHRRAPRRGPRGFTLAELMVVIVLMGLIAAMAGPRMNRWIQTISQRSAGNQLVADLAWARSFAAREGQTVSLRVVNANTYTVTVDQPNGQVARQIKRVNLPQLNRGTGFTVASARIAFDSRGVLRLQESTTDSLRLVRGPVQETVRVTPVGRPYRVR